MIKASIRKELFTVQGKINLVADIEIKKGDFATIFGKSGTGKTTILRMLAGLVEPDEGFIEVDSEIWFDSRRKINLSPQKRRIGFVFEDYALFPNMTVRQNLEFAMSGKSNNPSIDELLQLVDLKKFADRSPAELSAGQKQRVALIRAVAKQPRIFLLDEPLSALDTEMRLRLQDAILGIYKRFGTTTILVSHDLPEIFRLSQLVFVLEEGKVTKIGKPLDVFFKSKLNSTSNFIGEVVDIKEACNIIIVQMGNELIQTALTTQELKNFKIGDRIIILGDSFLSSV
jgi:molybdate transport system ATP-binding protein